MRRNFSARSRAVILVDNDIVIEVAMCGVNVMREGPQILLGNESRTVPSPHLYDS